MIKNLTSQSIILDPFINELTPQPIVGRLYNRELSAKEKLEQQKALEYISNIYYEKDPYVWDLQVNRTNFI